MTEPEKFRTVLHEVVGPDGSREFVASQQKVVTLSQKQARHGRAVAAGEAVREVTAPGLTSNTGHVLASLELCRTEALPCPDSACRWLFRGGEWLRVEPDGRVFVVTPAR